MLKATQWSMIKYLADGFALTAPAWILMFTVSILLVPNNSVDVVTNLISVGLGLWAMPYAIAESYETWKKYNEED